MIEKGIINAWKLYNKFTTSISYITQQIHKHSHSESGVNIKKTTCQKLTITYYTYIYSKNKKAL
jgi:hypothetical protein